MIFIYNSQGTSISAIYEPVYQGSNNANKITFIAPFSKSTQPSVAFTLPNGISTEPYIMRLVPNPTGETVYDIDKNAFNVWSADIDFPITEFVGIVDVQFTVYLTADSRLTTYTSSFEVEKGVPNEFPPTPEETTYNKILSYLASINADTNEAILNSIAYVRFIAPEPALVNSPVNSPSGTLLVELIGQEPLADEDADFTESGMTENLTMENLKSPATVGKYFYSCESNPSTAGFEITFVPSVITQIQLYVYNVKDDTNLKVYYTTPGSATEHLAGEIVLTETSNPDMIEIVPFQFSEITTNYIEKILIVQETGDKEHAFYCKGIEIFDNYSLGDRKYEIVLNNGIIYYIDTFDAKSLLNYMEGLLNSAEQSKEDAKEYAENTQALFDNANQIGGVPLLVDIEGEPKLPSVFINLTNINNYVTITDVSQLDTIPALVGDVARLVVDVDGESGDLEVVKSYVLLSIENGQRTWALYGTSYADNAGNAEFAKTSYNAQSINGQTIGVYTEQEFNNLSSFPNISFVGI